MYKFLKLVGFSVPGKPVPPLRSLGSQVRLELDTSRFLKTTSHKLNWNS